MTIYEALKKDHVKVGALLDQLVAAAKSDDKTRSSLIQQIRDELIPHARAEEAVFYNSLREISGAKGMAFHGYAEHAEAETILRTLQVTDAMNINWTAAAEKLRDAIKHHVADEENEMIPAAQKLFLDQEAEMMGEAFEKMKPEIKKGSFLETTLDMVANMMPDRLRPAMRKFTTQPDQR